MVPHRRLVCKGFTLVELLVVIGIIALLLALLLPTLSRAREAGNRIKCLAALRSMAQAAHAHAAEHDGYMPAAGYIGPVSQGIRPTPELIGDSRRSRYMYCETDDALPLKLMPLTLSLGSYMSFKVPYDKLGVRNALKNEDLQRLFTCPSHSNRLSSWTISDSNGWSRELGEEYTSYVANSSVLGVMPAPIGGLTAGGKVTRIRRASEVFLFADGNPNKMGDEGFSISSGYSVDDTLYTFWRMYGTNSRAFDYKRHRNLMNVVYVDGHAETVVMPREDRYLPNNGPFDEENRGDFDRIGISKGIYN